jgi:hypothetical protein
LLGLMLQSDYQLIETFTLLRDVDCLTYTSIIRPFGYNVKCF